MIGRLSYALTGDSITGRASIWIESPAADI